MQNLCTFFPEKKSGAWENFPPFPEKKQELTYYRIILTLVSYIHEKNPKSIPFPTPIDFPCVPREFVLSQKHNNTQLLLIWLFLNKLVDKLK